MKIRRSEEHKFYVPISHTRLKPAYERCSCRSLFLCFAFLALHEELPDVEQLWPCYLAICSLLMGPADLLLKGSAGKFLYNQPGHWLPWLKASSVIALGGAAVRACSHRAIFFFLGLIVWDFAS